MTRIGLPAVLKTRRLGYDGKGQAVIHDPLLAEDAWRAIGELPSILERFVAFDRELSILGVRDRNGSTAFYPLVENHHRDGILRWSIAPAPDLTSELQSRAETYARLVMDRLDYVGVLAIELFQMGGRARGKRDGAARAQLRPLDDRGGPDESVRESPPSRRGVADRSDGRRRAERDGESDRRSSG